MFKAQVAGAAADARALVASGSSDSEALWRFGILQLLDDYDSTLRLHGIEAAARVFEAEPPLTEHSGLDAAYAALACWLAARDEWTAPDWAQEPSRIARPWWFVSESSYGRAWAMVESPGEFRIRGIFITKSALARV